MLKPLLARFTRGAGVSLPDALWDQTLGALPFVARLDTNERAQLRALCGRLLASKEMAGAGGLELTAAIQLNIAVQACVPILKLGLDWYRGWTSIIVYPGEFLVPRQIIDEAGVTHEYVEPITGEAWDGGPILLSWEDAQRSRTEDGAAYCVVIHEFAHKIDLLNGEADGIPPFSAGLHSGLSLRIWKHTLADAYQRFSAELELIESELPDGLDPDSEAANPYYQHLPFDAYAVIDAGEFFAVSAEAFFIEPLRLQRALPEWYELLARFFLQDPLAGPNR